MLPGLPHSHRGSGSVAPRRWLPLFGAVAATVSGSHSALAQIAADAAAPDKGPVAGANTELPASPATNPVNFEADRLEYSNDTDVVTAIGNVVLTHGERTVRAEKVTWNRKTGQIVATGNIRLVDDDGNQLFTDRIELTDELKTGAMAHMLLALREGGRLAAQSGEQNADGDIVLNYAGYTACAVEDEKNCPKRPSWRVNARTVIYEPDTKTVKFKGASLELFGARLMPLPGLALATDGRAISGLLIPDVSLTPSNGIEVKEAYYQRLSNNRDVTATAYVYTKAAPMASLQYRALTEQGAYQITGYMTRSERLPVIGAVAGAGTGQDFRGYIFGNGHFQLSPNWSVTGSVRRATDRTFLRRYDISRDDRLRSMVEAERIDANSYLSIAGWATQTMRVGVDQGQVPVALPAIDYRRRLSDPLLGGKFELQFNSLAILRSNGQDTQRAFAGARWDLRRLTGMGQEVTVTGLLRGDVYHSSNNLLTSTVGYRGNPGWEKRVYGLGAIDVKWPLAGNFLGGTQVLSPRVQLVASPAIRNLAIPNEDARAVDLEDSNLFALNRFPGYDRVEDGVRVTYGLDYQLDWRRWRVKTTIGQSYRFSNNTTLLPSGTGLADKVSDLVGRTEIRYRDFIKLTHRFRLDKDNLAVRRNEFDATIGNQRTYAEIGYLRLNRDVPATFEDLRDREEIRVAGRVAFARYWSLFGAGVFNLTSKAEDPAATTDGFEPLRTRLGVAYQDDCLDLSFTWLRDYVGAGDARLGNTFQIHFSFRNIGFR